MDEAEECFGLLVGRHVVLVASCHVASHDFSARYVTTFPADVFPSHNFLHLLFFTGVKNPPKVSVKTFFLVTFFKARLFRHSSPTRCSKNAQKNGDGNFLCDYKAPNALKPKSD